MLWWWTRCGHLNIQLIIILIEISYRLKFKRLCVRTRTWENKWSVLYKPITTSFPNKQQITADDAICDCAMCCCRRRCWWLFIVSHKSMANFLSASICLRQNDFVKNLNKQILGIRINIVVFRNDDWKLFPYRF